MKMSGDLLGRRGGVNERSQLVEILVIQGLKQFLGLLLEELEGGDLVLVQ